MIRSFPLNSLVAYGTKGKAAAFSVGVGQQIFVFNVRAFNNSGGAINVGILKRLVYPRWNLFQFTNTGPAVASVGAAINAGTATAIFSGTNNDGFIVQSKAHFGMVGFTISTNQAGGVFEYTYWNGTSFVALTTLEVPANYNAATNVWIVFQPPQDWVAGATAITGLDQTLYSIRVRSTTAPGGAVSANAMWVGKFLELYQGVANNAAVQLSFPDSKPLLLDGGETLIPYFSTANAANQFGAYYAFNGT